MQTKKQWHRMNDSKNYNRDLQSSSTGPCLWSLEEPETMSCPLLAGKQLEHH